MEPNEPIVEKKLPFNNLYLNAGVVNGRNEWWMYVMGIVVLCLVISCSKYLWYFLEYMAAGKWNNHGRYSTKS
ncbi:MAG: hypothetical protein IPJ32_07670 [Sphingobacteriaceae bacterium]|nr:hypothetical protein [Sphingobacteriaceae bacterium]